MRPEAGSFAELVVSVARGVVSWCQIVSKTPGLVVQSVFVGMVNRRRDHGNSIIPQSNLRLHSEHMLVK